jgi:multicomponent K+:H+ antiporter subunit A
VKAGVFLLARFFPVLSGTPSGPYLVMGAGLATLLVGAYFALFKHDLKGLLAYSTISHLGLITLLFGIGTPLAAVAGVFHIINHATFKASLFMAAGIIDHECGTRDMRRINGLWRYMPYTATLAMVAAAAMAGVPLFNGFLSKEMFFGEAVNFEHYRVWDWVLPAPAAIAGHWRWPTRCASSTTSSSTASRDLPRTPHEPPRWMKVPVEVLVAVCLAGGHPAGLTVAPFLYQAVAGVLQDEPPYYSLAIWHGVTPALLMSILALVGGVLVYWAPPAVRLAERWHGAAGCPGRLPLGGRRVWRWRRGDAACWIRARCNACCVFIVTAWPPGPPASSRRTCPSPGRCRSRCPIRPACWWPRRWCWWPLRPR